MQHTIQTFRAATMNEAMDLVRRELGQNAVVMESKSVATRRLLPWPSTREEIEVTAHRSVLKTKPRPAAVAPRTQATPRVIRTLAESLAAPTSTSRLFPPLADLPSEEETLIPTSVATQLQGPALPVEEVPMSSAKSSERSASEGATSLQSIVSLLERHSRSRIADGIPKALLQNYCQLLDLDVDDGIARELITRVHQQLPVSADAEAITAMLTVMIERELRCAPTINPRAGRRQIVTLVGPTGVGKTTTLAKLAGQFQLQEGLRVGLIAADTYRVGAIDQLRTYAEILQAPLLTAANPDELRGAIDRLDDVDLILIDTAGRSPNDEVKMRELKGLVDCAASDHVLLVLSFAGGAKSVPRIADCFSMVKPTSLALTKLDEAHASGGLLTVARDVECPLSYITTGQDVPNQIEAAHATRLARLIMGRDSLHS